jgi:hypothetical protein
MHFISIRLFGVNSFIGKIVFYLAKSRSQMDLLFGKKSFTGKIIIWEKMFHRWIVYLAENVSQMKFFCVIDND